VVSGFLEKRGWSGQKSWVGCGWAGRGDDKEGITIFLEKKEKWKDGTTGYYKTLIGASFNMIVSKDTCFSQGLK